MQRQTSILSFLQKPSPDNRKSDRLQFVERLNGQHPDQFPVKQRKQNLTVAGQASDSSCEEVIGTDTPPEKLPRQLFAADDQARPSLFSSIMHKFAKVGEQSVSRERSEVDNGSSNVCSVSNTIRGGQGVPKQGTSSQHSQKESAFDFDTDKQGCPLGTENVPDILGPVTPAMRPLVPRLKRIQEDCCSPNDRNYSSLLKSSKRVKPLHDSETGKNNGEVLETIKSRFEWLEPSRIKDANGRRHCDPLYDKRTVYIPPDCLKKMTASQKQYWSVKCQYMDVVLFFKVGKFYELYELDAEIGHKELDWKMTCSGVGKCRQFFHMQVGISESGIDDAVQKLVARGYKVGRIEQTETSDQAKARGATSVIQRKLVHVATPSTPIDGNIGPDAVHLLALKEVYSGLENGSITIGFAFVDCAALKFWVGSLCDDASCAALGALLMQVSPKEVIYESRGLSKDALKALQKYSSAGSTTLQLTPASADFQDASEVRKLIQLRGYFKDSSNSWDCALSGIMHHDVAICALGGIVAHLSRLMLKDILHNGDILLYEVYSGSLRLDGQTLVNLEIFSNNADGGRSGTLYKYLDCCITASGKRLLRGWICHPLKDVADINNRLNAVEALITHPEMSYFVAQYLHKLPDIERLLGRVKASVGSSVSLLLPLVGKKVLKQRVKTFGSLVKGLRIGMDLLMALQKENGFSSLSKVLNLPSLSGSKGLDELLTQVDEAMDSNFPHYQDHDITDSEVEILSVLIESFVEKAPQWSRISHALNCIDVLRSFAMTANSSCGTMCRPDLLPPDSGSIVSSQETDRPVLKIKGLWHPYALGESGGSFVPNDIYLGEDTTGCCPRTLLLTGPNMGGKSTLLRATCLAVIMAQLGCYVPCEMCVLSPVDTIFTRLGAIDRIMTGESTFFIECMETASVLHSATQNSLVLLDELGRGTSTFDGYAIAYAVFRHLVELVCCRLLFATHYHPLTKEFACHPCVKLQHMACTFRPKKGRPSEDDQDLVFLYRLTAGACPESYGLQVALMAGIPKQVVEVASKASHTMKDSVGKNFRSSEQRSEFSTLHEEWLKTLLEVSNVRECYTDNDASDTLFCLWHELKTYRLTGQQ